MLSFILSVLYWLSWLYLNKVPVGLKAAYCGTLLLDFTLKLSVEVFPATSRTMYSTVCSESSLKVITPRFTDCGYKVILLPGNIKHFWMKRLERRNSG